MISSCFSYRAVGFIKIFNFHSEILLNEIKIKDIIYGICLWNKNNIFVGCKDCIIRLLDINKRVVVENKNYMDIIILYSLLKNTSSKIWWMLNISRSRKNRALD